MKTKNEIYNFIIDNINNAISEPWETADLKINVSDNFSSYKGFYTNNEGQKNIKVSRFDPQIDLDLIDLHKLTTVIDPEVKRWNIANFNLKKDEMFSIEFIWDQELYDSVSQG